MSAVLGVLPSLVIALVLVLACAPWGAPDDARFMMPLLPYMAAHVFLARGVGVVPSPVLFAAGLVMDLATHGPLGFWAIIYLSGALFARQLPGAIMQTVMGRLGALAATVLVLFVVQIAVASLYKLEWVDGRGVIAGTSLAALMVLIVDLLWRPGQKATQVNVTQRGARQAGRVA